MEHRRLSFQEGALATGETTMGHRLEVHRNNTCRTTLDPSHPTLEHISRTSALQVLNAPLGSCSNSQKTKTWKHAQRPAPSAHGQEEGGGVRIPRATRLWKHNHANRTKGALLGHREGLRDSPAKRNKSARERPMPQKTPGRASLTNGTRDPGCRQATHALDPRLGVARWDGEGMGRMGVWGVADPNSCTWRGETSTACPRAHGPPSSPLDWEQEGGEREPNPRHLQVPSIAHPSA